VFEHDHLSVGTDRGPDDKSRPTKLTHVVLNSAEVEKQTKFFLDVLGFKWSDSTFLMPGARPLSAGGGTATIWPPRT
jgi:catechol-2,3-dioxygenase